MILSIIMLKNRRTNMSFSLETIKNDILTQTDKQFYTKHIVRSDNWYFENVLGSSPEDQIRLADDAKLIISDCFGVSFNSIMMVGSGKIGYSLSPSESKLFKPFNTDEKVRNLSDLDFAIISNDIFVEYWKNFRHSFEYRYTNTYKHIYQDLYRGYISERNILEVEGCRKIWKPIADLSKKRLYEQMYIKSEISYRIYRSWEDFEDYNLQSINKIKRGL